MGCACLFQLCFYVVGSLCLLLSASALFLVSYSFPVPNVCLPLRLCLRSTFSLSPSLCLSVYLFVYLSVCPSLPGVILRQSSLRHCANDCRKDLFIVTSHFAYVYVCVCVYVAVPDIIFQHTNTFRVTHTGR